MNERQASSLLVNPNREQPWKAWMGQKCERLDGR